MTVASQTTCYEDKDLFCSVSGPQKLRKSKKKENDDEI